MPTPRMIVIDGDKARTRKTDPTTSHKAGDTSQKTLKAAKVAVLTIVRDNPGVTGTALNELYVFARSRHSWMPQLAFDSPRKRASDLAADGYLEMVDDGRRGRNNQPEHTYRLTAYGRKVITLGKAVA